jgi:tetrapyrrole methylase family protein / MazG family protein
MSLPTSTNGSMPKLARPAPAAIRIVGLGPGDLADLTLGAWQALSDGPRIVARTRRHPIFEQWQLPVPLQACDDLYEQHAQFAQVYTAIATRVLAQAQQPGGVVYAVPGHPWVGEATTRLILDQAAAAGLTVQIIGGTSFIEAAFGAVGVDCMDGGQVVDAMLMAQQHHPRVEVGLPLLVGQLYSRDLAADVKLTLMNAYPDTHPVTLVQAAATAQQQTQTVPLHELDHETTRFDHLTSLYVPPLVQGSFTDLQAIIAHLRAPEGCPWDQEQTLESLRQDLLGEAVEVMEAIDLEAADPTGMTDNSNHIAEELGDLYLVATMLVQIATEEGRFRAADVMREIVTKLIRRHPHVFGETVIDEQDAAGVAQIVANWDAIKAAEKAAKGQAESDPLEGVPAHLPALEKARKLQQKAAKAGLLDRKAVAQTQPHLAQLLGHAPTAAELGALLWQLVALAHTHDLNAEDALRTYAVAFRDQQNHSRQD